MNDYVLTVNDDGDLAIRTVPGTEDSNVTDTTSVITRTDDGKLAVRVVGGGDSSNLGYFATLTALQEAYPTAEPGNWAIVGTTDTVWVWDEDTSAWVDTDQKGQVTSVNNQTGAVTLDINDVAPTQTGKSGYVLGTDGFVAGWVRPEIVQRSALPQASEDEVDKIYQYVGTTDATYTKGYFYKCVSDGQVPATYSWEQVDVQPSPDPLPSQTGQSGKFLTTDGTDASWSDKPLVNKATGSGSLNILGDSGLAVTAVSATSIGWYAAAKKTEATAIGYSANSSANYSTALGAVAVATKNGSIAIGDHTSATGVGAIQLGGSTTGSSVSNSDDNTLKVANANGNFEMMSADGTIPEARLADTTNATAGQALVLNSQGNAEWKDIVSTPATAPTLAVADWSSNTQTVTVTGVTASNTVIVSPAPASAVEYAACGILCTTQGTDSLTFTCTAVPANALTVNVVILS